MRLQNSKQHLRRCSPFVREERPWCCLLFWVFVFKIFGAESRARTTIFHLTQLWAFLELNIFFAPKWDDITCFSGIKFEMATPVCGTIDVQKHWGKRYHFFTGKGKEWWWGKREKWRQSKQFKRPQRVKNTIQSVLIGAATASLFKSTVPDDAD